MQRYLARRLALMIPVVVGVSILVFSLIHLAPGDPVILLLGKFYDPAFADRQRHELGLDRPLVVQYLVWAARAVQGDFGNSISHRAPVATLVHLRLPITLLLAGGSMVISLLIAVPIGTLSAIRRGRVADHLGRVLAMIGVSMPIFWVGILLIIGFSLYLDWLPPGGSPRELGWQALVLPSIALGVSFAALVMRITRSSMLDVLNEDYIRTARSKGLSGNRITYKHALRNALIPVCTVVGLQFGTVLGGTVLTETVFNIPGMGRLLVEAIGSRDYPLLQGTILVTSVLFVLANLIVDVAYAALDPRIRYG